MQQTMIGSARVADRIKKELLCLEMYICIAMEHAAGCGKQVFYMVALRSIIQRVDDGDYASVLFVNYVYTQIVLWLPYDKEVMLQRC